MTDHPHRARRVVARGTLSVALVLALSGALFAANAKFARAASGERHPQDLRELAQAETAKVERLAKEVDDLRATVDDLTADESAGTPVGEPSTAYLIEGGIVPVTGPGVTVQLDDAPPDTWREDAEADILVVHQQDLQAVMNALWAGGAEAMMLMDQRVISTSAFQCVGNVLKLHGRVYSPPYVVRAIGDPEELRDGLDASPSVQLYLRDAAQVGLGWSVTDADEPLELPAYSGSTELSSATVPDGVEILPGLEAALAAEEARRATTGPTRSAGPEDQQ